MRRFLPFGDLRRDGPDYDNPSLEEARNLLPVYGVYRPVRTLQPVSKSDTNLSSFTPWIDFDGVGATSKVDFTVNPVTAFSEPLQVDHTTIGIRFRTNSQHDGLFCGAGLDDLTGVGTDFGWGFGTEADGQTLRGVLATGSAASPGPRTVGTVQVPGTYADLEWHVVRLTFLSAEGLDPRLSVQVDVDGIEGDEARAGGSETIDTTDWAALNMRWGYGAVNTERFVGEVERVLVWNSAPTDQEFNDQMNSPLEGLMVGGWTESGYAYPLKAGTGSTVVNYGADTTAGDGVMDAGVTWEGASFDPTARSGITGGIAHFYTRAQELLSRGPNADISESEIFSFGRTNADFPDDRFRQIWSKEPNDSRGIGIAVTDPQSTSVLGSYVGRFKGVDDPGTDDDHHVEYRYQIHGNLNQGQDATVDLNLFLDDGPTEIKQLGAHSSTSPDNEWHHEVVALSPAEAAAITNYENLRIRAEADITGAQRQRAEPSADLANPDAWVNEAGETTDLWESIDDAQDMGETDTWVETPGLRDGGTSTARFKLADANDPVTDEGFNLRVNAQASEPGVDIHVKVLEDGETRFSSIWQNLPTTPTVFAQQFGPRLPGFIQDFSKLQCEVTFKAHGNPGTGDTEEVPLSFDGPLVNTIGDVTLLQQVDGQFVATGVGGDGGRFRCSLEPGHDPGTDIGHTIKLRARRVGGDASVSVQFWAGGTQVYDSRSFEDPRPLPTSFQDVVFQIPTHIVAQIPTSGFRNLKLQVLTHAGSSGGTANYDYAAYVYPARRKGRLNSMVLAMPQDLRAMVSWVRLFVPDPNQAERGDVTELYAGDYKNIYRIDNSPWEIVSKAGGYADAAIPRSWVFAPFGANVIATNKVDPVQVKAPTDSTFSDLITSTSKPQAAAACVSHGHLVLGNIEYLGGGGGDPDGQADEWWSSALDDPADFDISLTTQSNRKRILSAPGEIVSMVGGDFITALKQKSVHRMDYVGGVAVFNENVVSSSDGTVFPRGVVQLGRDVYFVDTDGFKVCRSGQRVDPIGVGAVNRMVTDSAYERRAIQPVDTDEMPVAESVCIGAYDRITGCIWWSLRTLGAIADDPSPIWRNNVIVIYNPNEDRWAVIEPLTPQLAAQAEEEDATGIPPPPGGEDDPLSITHLYSLPVQKEASDSIARGIGVISMLGSFPSNYTLDFARFLGPETYASLVETKIWSSKIIAQDIREVLINFLRPSYRMAPEPTARPIVGASVFSADDPLMQFGVEQEDADLSQANDDLWYPLSKSQGEFFVFRLLYPNLVDMTIREINGIELDFEDAGEY